MIDEWPYHFKDHPVMLLLPEFPKITHRMVMTEVHRLRGGYADDAPQMLTRLRELPSIHHWYKSPAKPGAVIDVAAMWLPLKGVHHPRHDSNGTYRVRMELDLSTGRTVTYEGRFWTPYAAQLAGERYLSAIRQRRMPQDPKRVRKGRTYITAIRFTFDIHPEVAEHANSFN